MSQVLVRDGEQVVGALHSVLLALGSRLSDAALGHARVLLAEGWVNEVIACVTEAALDEDVPLTGPEHDALAAVLVERGQEHERDLLSAVRVVDDEAHVPLQVVSAASAAADAADRALALALDDLGCARGAWRVDARGADGRIGGVWLAELDEPSGVGLAAAAAALHRSLVTAGVADPAIDVIAFDGWAPQRALQILFTGRRIWPTSVHEPFRTARMYDGVDASGAPFFDASRPRLHGERRERALDRLRQGTIVQSVSRLLPDVVEGGSLVVPNVWRTCGRWIWHETIAHHLEQHGIAPEPDLMEHLEHGPEWREGDVPQERLERARAQLR